MEKKLIELDSIAEFNKNLALLSIQVDALQNSYSSEKLNHVNRVKPVCASALGRSGLR